MIDMTALPTKAMLFAAGLGTRLRPLTLKTPKPLIDVGGKPLIAYALETLRRGGVTDVMINTHWLGDQIQAAIGDGAAFGVRCSYSDEPVLLGTGGGLYQAHRFFENEAAFWTVNSDTLLDVDLTRVWEAYATTHPAATLVTQSRQPAQFGGVWAENNQVVSFLTAPTDRPQAQEVDFCGLSLLTPAIFSYLRQAYEKNPTFCLIREGLVPMLAEGKTIQIYPVNGYFNDVGTPERLAEAQEFLETQRNFSQAIR